MDVIVAEGQTEVGLVRGLDNFWVKQGKDPLALAGAAVTNGGGMPQAAGRAMAFAKLGYRTMLLMDDDRPWREGERAPLDDAGVDIISWGNGYATEDALFQWLAWPEVLALLSIAEQVWGADSLDQWLCSYSNGQLNLAKCRQADQPAHRALLAQTAKRQSWFKRMDFGERVGDEVIGPGWARSSQQLKTTISVIYNWTHGVPNG